MSQGITLVCCTQLVPDLAAHLLKKKMVIGGFILRNMKLESIVDCIPVARAGETEANLKPLARGKHKLGTIKIHINCNDTVCNFAENNFPVLPSPVRSVLTCLTGRSP